MEVKPVFGVRPSDTSYNDDLKTILVSRDKKIVVRCLEKNVVSHFSLDKSQD